MSYRGKLNNSYLLALVCGVYCEFVTFPLVTWVRCGTWLYRFLIFAPLPTLDLILRELFISSQYLQSAKTPSTRAICTKHSICARRFGLDGMCLCILYVQIYPDKQTVEPYLD